MSWESKEQKENFLEKYNEAIKYHTLLSKKLDEMKKILDNNCEHENTKQVEDHYPGSYYDRSYSTVTIYCKDCGKRMDKPKTIYVGGYG